MMNFWLYPAQPTCRAVDVLITNNWAAAADRLNRRRKVLFTTPTAAALDPTR